MEKEGDEMALSAGERAPLPRAKRNTKPIMEKKSFIFIEGVQTWRLLARKMKREAGPFTWTGGTPFSRKGKEKKLTKTGTLEWTRAHGQPLASRGRRKVSQKKRRVGAYALHLASTSLGVPSSNWSIVANVG